MRRTMVFAAFAAALALALVSAGARAAQFTPLSVKGDDSERRTGLWFCPEYRNAAEVVPLGIRITATKESVTGGVAMRVDVAKGSTGTVTYENSPYPAGTAGITMYAKASRELTLTVKGRASFKVGTEWKKIDLPWEALGTAPAKPGIGYLFKIGLARPAAADCHYVIDRLGCEGPAFDANPATKKLAGPDETIGTKEILGGAETLAPTVARLKAKKPFKIVAFGDSVTAASQAQRANWHIKQPDIDRFLYFSHLARLLEGEFGFKGVTPVKNGYGGWTSARAKTKMREVFAGATAEDLVMIEFGANDLGWAGSTVDAWLANMKTLVDEAKKHTSQIIVMSPTTGGKVPQKAAEVTQKFTAFARREKIAWVDITRWSMYRGEKYAWAYLANGYHPDFMGHIIMAELMMPLFTREHFAWPRYAAGK